MSAYPHKDFAARMEGNGTIRGPARRKHNGRLRRLPHRGRLRAKTKHDLRMLSWTFETSDGFESFSRKWLNKNATG